MSAKLSRKPVAMDAAEWDARVKLAACYRMVAKLGMDDLIYNHISTRVPGHEDQFLINPYGLLFDEITASSLVRIDTEGRKLDDTPHEVNVAAFVIHAAIHKSPGRRRVRVAHAFGCEHGRVRPGGGAPAAQPVRHALLPAAGLP